MARQIIQKTLDDLNGEEGAEEHSFALDGIQWDIDLTDEHWREIRDFMQKYVDAAPGRPRRVYAGGVGVRPTPPAPARNGRAVVDPSQNKAIRAWVGRHWQTAGLREPNPNWLDGKGAIPNDYREAFEHHKGVAPDGPAGGQEPAPQDGGVPEQRTVETVPPAAFSSLP